MRGEGGGGRGEASDCITNTRDSGGIVNISREGGVDILIEGAEWISSYTDTSS